jgi:hypothetical protein
MICSKAVQGRYNEVSKQILSIGTGVTYIKGTTNTQPIYKTLADFFPFFSPIEKGSSHVADTLRNE